MAKILGFLLILFLFFSCKKDQKNEVDVSDIDIHFNVDRFEELFYTSNISELSIIKREYPYMFPQNVADSIWISKIKNENEQFLFEESQRVFGDFSQTKIEIENLFKHIKYYNPKFNEPNITTHISDLDYQYPVIYADSLLFVSLDMYLGKSNIVYSDFPKYLTENYEKERVVVAIANEIIFKSFPKYRSKTFLDRMINEGRKMYLLDCYLPEVEDGFKIGYPAEKLVWAQENEINIWRFFIDKELLFSNDTGLNARFIDLAPFSKFYQETDQESPGQIGVWLGWQIVRSYMRNNDVTLQQFLSKSTEEIYAKSKYKPKK